MKKLLLAVLMLSQLISGAQSISVIPKPASVQILNEAGFRLKNNTTIVADDKQTAQYLISKLAPATSYHFTTGTKGKIELRINNTKDNRLGEEGYTLVSGKKKITIHANTAHGLFNGVQTLLQLLPKEIESKTQTTATWIVPAVNITDTPRFAWRGLMLDVSRHFFSKEDVKRYIDNMSRYKYNVFHWHLTDDHGWRIEIKSLPRLTEVGACRVQRYGKFGKYDPPKDGEPATDCGYYTQEDIKEVIAYAAERHIQILPEIDVPGHSMAAIASYPFLSCTQDPNAKVNPGSAYSIWDSNHNFRLTIDNSLDPSKESTYNFLDTVFTEIAALFPYPYIHIGGDECYKGYWNKDSNCINLMQREGLKDAKELQSYFVKRVEKILKSKGKKLIGWDEILEGGIAPEATVMSWQGMQGGIEAAKQGHYVVMTPNQNVYIDLPQGDVAAEPDALTYGTVRLSTAYNFEPVPDGIDSKYILGGQANLWTEKVPTIRHAEYMAYPRAWALADVYWSPKNSKNWNEFITRMEQQMQRADIAEMNYARSVYDAIVKTTIKDKVLTADISTEIEGLDVYYTLNETYPDRFSTKYTKPFVIPEGNVTLKVITYRNGKPIGKMIVLSREELQKRAKKK